MKLLRSFLRMFAAFLVAGVLSGCFETPVPGQAEPRVGVLTPGPEEPLEVQAIAVQPDGRFFIGGQFSMVQGIPRRSLARINADGTLDSSFDPGIGPGLAQFSEDADVNKIAVQPDGRILVSGYFTSWSGHGAPGLVRLHIDGTVDTSFNTQGLHIRAWTLQLDGSVLVLDWERGVDTPVDPQIPTDMKILCLLPDGTRVSHFGPFSYAGQAGSMAVDQRGRVFLAGYFDPPGGLIRDEITAVRIGPDGFHPLLSASEGNPGSLFRNNSADGLMLQPDGHVVLIGRFEPLNQRILNLYRLTDEGVAEGGGFNDHLQARSNALDDREEASAAALQADGGVLITGDFDGHYYHCGQFQEWCVDDHYVTGQYAENILKLRRNGALDPSFAPHQETRQADSRDRSLSCVLVKPDGRVIVGGREGYQQYHNGGVVQRLDVVRSGANPQVTWFRSGTAPELDQAGLDFSPDGQTWTSLRTVVFLGGVWRTTDAGLTLPEQGWLRGRGLARQSRGSISYVEYVARYPVDTLAPETAIIFGPPAQTSATTASFNFSSDEPAQLYRYSLDGAAWTDTPLDTLALTPGNGPHTLQVAAVDLAGNIDPTPARRSWTIVPATTPEGQPDLAWSAAGGGAGPAVSLNGEVTCLAVQPDGKVLAAGRFTQADAEARQGIVRFHETGALESTETFNAGLAAGAGLLETMAVQPDGRIVVAGTFLQWTGVPKKHLARLAANGALEPGFPAGVGPDQSVHAVLLQPDGKIVVAGSFTQMHGQPRQHLARLHADGSLDPEFTGEVDGVVTSMALQQDGKIVLCGVFEEVNGQPARSLVRLRPNGVLDDTFTPVIPGEGYYFNVAVQPNGRILVAGIFFGPGTERGLLRLLPSGVEESAATFHPTGVRQVDEMTLQADGRIVIAGSFTAIGGEARGGLARLLPDGTLESTQMFDSGAGAMRDNVPGSVRAVALQRNGKILVGGDFTHFGGRASRGLARLRNEPAVSELFTRGNFSAEWLVGGSAPELRHVRFSLFNGSAWQDLGPGARTPGGWGIRDLNLPRHGLLRTSGYSAARRGHAGLIMSEITLDSPLNLWRDVTFGQAADLPTVSGDLVDADSDGSPNLIEYATGSDPRDPRSRPRMTGYMDPAGLSFTYERSLAATDVTVTLEHSTNLQTWTPASYTEEEVANNGTTCTMRARVNVDLREPVLPQAFLRARVSPAFPGPSIAVAHPVTVHLANGLTPVDFGDVLTGQNLAKTFTVKNRGTTALEVSAIAVSGGEAADFGLTLPPLPVSVAPGQVREFTVTFTPSALGVRGTTLRVTSNDPDEGVFTLPLTGRGALFMAPEITVEQPAGTDLSDGATVHCGTVNPFNEAPERWFTIRNTGNVPLNVNDITVTGAHADDFPLSGFFQVPGALAPGESLTFRIVFFPGGEGNRSASLSIVSNDADEGTFDIALTGRGNTPPTLQLPASPLLVPATSAAGAVVNFNVTATDTEDAPPPTPVSTPASGSVFPLGATTVNVSVADSHGSTASGSFTVQVYPVAMPQTVAMSGLTVPGAPLPFLFTSEAPSLNAAGLAGYTATLSDGNVGLWTGGSGSAAALALTGQQAPGTVAGVNFWSFVAGPRPLNAAGQSAFAASLTGDGVDFSNDSGLWRGAAGSVQLLAREGMAAPGTAPGVLFNNLTANPALNDNGQGAFFASLTGVDVDGTNDRGYWTGTPGALVMLARTGAAAPGAPGETIATLDSPPVINAAGQSVIAGQLSNSDYALWSGSPGSLTLAARTGMTAPGTPAGVSFHRFVDRFSATRPVINAQNRIAFTAWLDTTLITPDSAYGIWTGPANGLALLARSANAAAGTPAGTVFYDFGTPLINATGRVAFHARTAPAPAPGEFYTGDGIWHGTAGAALTKVVRTGDTAPGAGAGVTFVSVNGGPPGSSQENMALNDTGEIVFMAEIAGPGVTTENDDTLWHTSPAGVLTLLLREGQSYTPIVGDPRTVASIRFAGTHPGGSGGADGQPAGLSDNGSTAVSVTFTDNATAVLLLPRP